MRNNLKPPFSINRNSKWSKGLFSWIPFNFNSNSNNSNTRLSTYDIINKDVYLFSGASFNSITPVPGPSNESVLLVKGSSSSNQLISSNVKSIFRMHLGLTISCWIYFDNKVTTANTESIYQFYDGSNIIALSTKNSTIQFSGFGYLDAATVTFNKGWNHVVVTIDNDTMRIYYNGERKTNFSILGTSSLNSQGDIQLGTVQDAYVFDLRLYDYTWSSDQVSQFYNSKQNRIDIYGSKRFPGIPGVIPFITGGMDLYTVNIASDNDTTDLYTSGQSVPISGNINLHTISSLPTSGNVDLYTRGLSSHNSGINLYVRGLSSYSNSSELYIEGMIPFASSINLYTYGISQANTAVNLFVSTPNGVNNNDTINLYTNSTTNSGIFNTASFFVKNSQQFDPRNSVNLSVKGPTGFDSESVNLFVQNQQDIDNGINLFVAGPNFTYSSGINLFITTPNAGGDSDGYTPLTDSVTLFIARDSEVIGNSINMFVKTAEPVNSGVDLYAYGVFTKSSDISMFTSGSGIPIHTTDTVGFYLRGGV
jgi:hypothetical protein